MKSSILLMVLAVVTLGSCSVYKTGQTPDDVYYSPAREADSYVAVNQDRSGRYRSTDYDNPDDYWLRMRVHNPYRWSTFDDYTWYDYRYNSWAFNAYNSYNPYGWNSFWLWNSYYNPYCTRIIIVNPKTNPVAYNRVRTFNLSSYTNTAYSNRNTSVYRTRLSSPTYYSGYNNSNSLGNSIRKVFSGTGSASAPKGYSPSSGSRPDRTYTPPASSSGSRSSSSSSSSSGGGGVSRPGRGN